MTPLLAYSLKRKCSHFDEIFIIGCIGSCQNDNFQCSQWWKFCPNDDIFVSVLELCFLALTHGYASRFVLYDVSQPTHYIINHDNDLWCIISHSRVNQYTQAKSGVITFCHLYEHQWRKKDKSVADILDVSPALMHPSLINMMSAT